MKNENDLIWACGDCKSNNSLNSKGYKLRSLNGSNPDKWICEDCAQSYKKTGKIAQC